MVNITPASPTPEETPVADRDVTPTEIADSPPGPTQLYVPERPWLVLAVPGVAVLLFVYYWYRR